MSLGQKTQILPNEGVGKNLSSPFTFPILVNIKSYQKYTKNTWNTVFIFFTPKYGVLPLLQERPMSLLIPQSNFVLCEFHHARG